MTKVEMNRRIKSFQFPRGVSVLAGEDVTMQAVRFRLFAEEVEEQQ